MIVIPAIINEYLTRYDTIMGILASFATVNWATRRLFHRSSPCSVSKIYVCLSLLDRLCLQQKKRGLSMQIIPLHEVDVVAPGDKARSVWSKYCLVNPSGSYNPHR